MPSLVARPAFLAAGEAARAQNVDGDVHVAVSLDESLLALHHRGVGHLAELLDHGGSNLAIVVPFDAMKKT